MPRTFASQNGLKGRAKATGHAEPAPRFSNDRVAELEVTVEVMQRSLDVQFKRIAAIQAQLDFIAAKVAGR